MKEWTTAYPSDKIEMDGKLKEIKSEAIKIEEKINSMIVDFMKKHKGINVSIDIKTTFGGYPLDMDLLSCETILKIEL